MENPYDQFDATSEAKDLATSFGVGSNQLLKMAGDVYGLATGNMDNVVSRQGQENIDYLQQGKSEKLRQAETRRKAAVDMEEGTLDKALAYVRETFTDPRLFLSTTAEAAPSLVGAGGIGAGARAAAGKVLAKKGAETAAKIGVGTAVAAGAGMQGTSVGADQYAEVVDLLQKMPEEQALKVPQIVKLVVEKGATLEEAKTALALDLARSTGVLAALASAGTQMLPGGRTIEKAIAGGAGKKLAGTALAGAAVGALGEGVQEALEEGSGAGVKNLLARAVEPEREITKGMGEAMGAGFAGAAPLGAAAGAASRTSRPVPTGETTAGKSGELLASDATTSEPRTSITDTPDLSLEGAGEMSTREMSSVLSARDSAARGFTPDPSDIATVEGVRRPQVEVSEEATKAAIVPVQEALDEWRNQNPDVGLSVTVVNDPNMRNSRNYGVRGYFDPNTGEVVINSAFTKPFEVESVVNHEWSHHTLSSEEGRAALAEFATRDIPKEELDALAQRYPNADNLTLVEEWIARNQEKSPGVFARIVAKIREWLNGKLGINMTNEEAARAMLRTLRERGAPVAEGSGEMRQSTTDEPVGEPESVKRDPGKSGMMASPSVVDINYDRAKRNLTSSDQARFRSDVGGFAPEATVYNAVGDWADGAENSIAAVFKDVRSPEELRQLAANAGLTGDQKAALWWRVEENGPDAIHQVTWPKEITMDEARQAMIDAGIENRTLIQTRDGVMGFVFDQGQQNLSKIDKLYESPTNPSTQSSPAIGEFVGSWSTRIEGKRAYRNVLGLPTKTPESEGVSGLGVRGRDDAETKAGSGSGGVLSSPPRVDTGTGAKTSSRQPNEAVRKIADDYNVQSGQEPIEHGHYVPVDESLAQRIAKAYDALPEVDRSPETVKAYEALAKEVADQWDFAVNNLGITFEPWTKEGQPYANSREMVKDVRDNNHIYFFQGGDPHPFLNAVDPKTGFTANDKLRAVHDLFGHAAEDYQFGPRGEENAWIKHSQMFSPEAQRALSSETRGQNSWVNFGDQNYENGVNKNIPAKDRPYAAQKTALLPEELTDWRAALGKSEPERASVLAKQPIRESLTSDQIDAVDKRQISELDIDDLVSRGILTDRHGKLLDELRSTSGGDSRIEVVDPKDLPPRAAAVYDPNTNTIRVSKDGKLDLGRVLMHEYTHALTFMGLKYADERMTSRGDIISATPRPGVDIRDLREASRQMDDLFSTAGKAANDLGEKFYGLTNRMEFVAEAFSSKKFQDFLSSIPSTNGSKQSLFDRFISIVKKILGTENDSLLTDVIRVTDPFVGAKKRVTGNLMISEDRPALPDEPDQSSVLAKQPIRESVTEEPVDVSSFRETRESLGLPTGTSKVSIEDVAKALNEFSKGKLGDQKFSDDQLAVAHGIANAVLEGRNQLMLGEKSGADWYDTDMDSAKKMLRKAIPTLKTNTDMVLFTAVMAPTSFGQNPVENLRTAVRVYQHAVDKGGNIWGNLAPRQDDGKGWTLRSTAVQYGIERLNDLVNDLGERGAVNWLLSKHPISELRKYNKNVTGNADDEKFGAYVFGPKGGPFFLNMNGIREEMTKDLWWSRTFNRWFGTMEDVSASASDKRAMIEEGMMDEQTGTPDTGGFKIRETPRNLGERQRMEAVAKGAADQLGLTVEELQATLWYYEQQLWKRLGARVESYSYSDGAKKVLSERGIQPPRIRRSDTPNEKRRQDAYALARNLGGL